GIKQPVENMIRAFEENRADAIGMSGLLVKSTVVMKEDLLTLNERGLQMPIILGGAALTRRYVEEDLRRLYKGPLYYGADAFAGLHIMDELCAPERKRAAGSVGLAALKPRTRGKAGAVPPSPGLAGEGTRVREKRRPSPPSPLPQSRERVEIPPAPIV